MLEKESEFRASLLMFEMWVWYFSEEQEADLIEIADSEHWTTLELRFWLDEEPLLEKSSSFMLVEGEMLILDVLWERVPF